MVHFAYDFVIVIGLLFCAVSVRKLPLIKKASSLSVSSHVQSFLSMEEGFTYTYSLTMGNAPIQVFILVESQSEKPNYYTFSLSIKVSLVERGISKPITMRLSVDPRQLDFAVFASPRASLPTGCLYDLRVWLRTSGIDHRIFAENDLWISRDPDFQSIGDASFAMLRNATQDMSVYQAVVGRARVSFTVRWKLVEPGVYTLSLDYDAGGAGKTLFENYTFRLDCEPQTLSFLIYSIPVSSTPPGATHRLRVWLRTPHLPPRPPTSSSPSARSSPCLTDSYIYQRLFKTDNFKLGAHLNFECLGTSVVIATREPPNRDNGFEHDLSNPNRTRRKSRLPPILSVDAPGERVNDR